ncbi:MAG: hypothetical protein KC636_11790, partial [Myxococcales bacterium]|nr:hypothetical protein [Myxococcales bacterium]
MLLAALLAFACGGRATEPAAATSAPRPPDAPQPEAIAAVEPEPAPAAEPEPAEPAPPKDPLAPLSAEQKATLWAGDADPLAPTSIHYVKSNEIRHDVWFPYIDGIGGAYVGVGSDQNYTVIAAARAELVFLLDIDQRVVDLHRIYEVLIEASEDPETLRERFNKDNAEESIALLDAAFADLDEAEQRRLRNDYRYSRETVFRHLRTVISRDRAGKPTSWLSDPAMYAHIRKL